MFKKGMKKPPNSGRQAGTPNKKKLLKVEDVLTANDFNPTEKLLELYKTMDDEQKIRTLCFLITYSQAKPTEVINDKDAVNDLSERLKDVSDDQLIKAIEYKDKDASS